MSVIWLRRFACCLWVLNSVESQCYGLGFGHSSSLLLLPSYTNHVHFPSWFSSAVHNVTKTNLRGAFLLTPIRQTLSVLLWSGRFRIGQPMSTQLANYWMSDRTFWNSLYSELNIPSRTLLLVPRMQAQQCASRIEPFSDHVALVQRCACRQASYRLLGIS